MEGKTIRQIADELGVSKDRVKYLVKKLPSEWVKKQGNITYINNDGERYIYMLMGKVWEKNKEITYVNNKLEQVFSQCFPTEEEKKDREIERLNARVAELERQLEYERASSEQKQALLQAWSDERQENLSRILEDNRKLLKLIELEQQLHAGTIQERLTVAQDQTEEDPVRSKRSLFSRLFKRNN